MIDTPYLLDFDDVLISPAFSNIGSRASVMLEKLPVMNANMRSIATPALVDKVPYYGGIGCSHRFQSAEVQLSLYKKAKQYNGDFWCSTGVSAECLEDAEFMIKGGCRHLCIDVAHGAQQIVVDFLHALTKPHDMHLMVGNFGSPHSVSQFFSRLDKQTIDRVTHIKLGVGPGSVCRTRSVTGVGYPQISLINETAKIISKDVKIVADGGIKSTGDIAKAIVAGADLVMTGRLFMDCEESDQHYRGSASSTEYQYQNKTHRAPEGVSEYSEHKTTDVKKVLENIRQSLASTLSYVDCRNIEELKRCAELIVVSPNTKIK